ncbi:MAG: hypothetical protein ACFE8L_06875 [Candidatus Hodarchaeota archaeon]
MDWSNLVDNIYLWYNRFIEWYLEQPVYGQILVIIGIVVLLALIITLVFYLIKGICYLIYYALKGVYYLLKGIGLGFYRLCEGFYYLVSGKPRPKTQKQEVSHEQSDDSTRLMENRPNNIYCNIMYCSECGNKFSEKMHNNLKTNRITFCVHCGKRFELIETPNRSISIYP